MSDFLTYGQVSQKLAVSAALVKKLAREKAFPKLHIGRRVVFNPADIDAYMSQLASQGNKTHKVEA